MTLLLAFTACLSPGLAEAGGDANVILGQKTLSEGTFDDLGVDGQSEFGVSVTLDFAWPVALAIDLLSTSDDKSETIAAQFPVTRRTEVDTLELDLGVRKFWEINKWRPFVGGGLSTIQLDTRQTTSTDFMGNIVEDTLIDDDDTGVGFWLSGGTLWTLPQGFNLGAEVRFSDADADLGAEGFSSKESFDSGGIHLGVILGYHW